MTINETIVDQFLCNLKTDHFVQKEGADWTKLMPLADKNLKFLEEIVFLGIDHKIEEVLSSYTGLLAEIGMSFNVYEGEKAISRLMCFKRQMLKELEDNSYKGDWKEWKQIGDQMKELYYHLGKLIKALEYGVNADIREHIADNANFLMMIGNSYNLYKY